jgi:hypothetical protein
MKLVAVHSASNAQNCGVSTEAFGTLIYPYLNVLETKWPEFKVESENRNALQRAKIDALNQFIRDEKKKGKVIIRGGGSCIAYGVETSRVKIQVSNDGATWKDVGTALGVNQDPGCIKKNGTTHPFSYWGLADKKFAKPGMYTRWITESGFISAFYIIPENPQRTTINCSDGIIIRKQSGLKPKCPSGFKETFDIGKPL